MLILSIRSLSTQITYINNSTIVNSSNVTNLSLSGFTLNETSLVFNNIG